MVTGIFPVSTTYVYALFDPGATHSFISSNFAKKHNFKFEPMESELRVDTPVGGVVVTDSVCKSCVVKIADRELLADLTLLEMWDFDIILGMDWLATHYAMVDCHRNKVIFQVPGEIEFCFVRSGAYTSPRVISALQARCMMKKRLVSAPILTITSGSGGFTIYSDASRKGLGCVLMQHGKVVAYASRQLKPYEQNLSHT